MQSVLENYRGVRLLINVNWDLMFTLGVVVVGLLAGAFLVPALLLP